MCERAIPARLSIDTRSGDGPDGRHRIGRNPAGGDAGTIDAPREPPQPPPTHWPDEGEDILLGGILIRTPLGNQTTTG